MMMPLYHECRIPLSFPCRLCARAWQAMPPWGLRMGSAACGREAKSLSQGGTLMTTGQKWVLGIAGLVAVVWACNSWANDAVEEERQIAQLTGLVSATPVLRATLSRRWTAAELANCEISPQTITQTACGRAWVTGRVEAVKAFESLPTAEQALIERHRATAEAIKAHFRVENTPATTTEATALCRRARRWSGQMETAVRDVRRLDRANMLGFEAEFLKWHNLMRQVTEHCP